MSSKRKSNRGNKDDVDRGKTVHKSKERCKSKRQSEQKENGLRKRSNEKVSMKSFQLGELNSTIITTKRLTVGVKGIFGNARTSNSVYRDIQYRIQNKKLSKAVASEVELSLSRIVSKRGGTPSCNSSSSGDLHTPCHFSTPFSNKCTVDRSCSSEKSKVDSCDDSLNGEALKTPLPLQNSYVKIAESIRKSLPSLKVFKAYDYSKKLKSELQAYYNTEYTVNISPKFRKEEFSQPTPVLDDVPPPACKKLCGEDSNPVEMRPCEKDVNETSKIKDCTFSQHKKSWLSEQEKWTSCDKVLHTRHESCDKVLHTRHAGQVPLDEKAPFNDIQKEDRPISNDRRDPNRQKFGESKDSTTVTHDYFNNFLLQPNIQQILSKPINMLRATRGSCEVDTMPSDENSKKRCDFLDYIDSIPLDALENEIFGTKSQCDSLVKGTDQSIGTSLPGIPELKRPFMESPSPPKLFRMNMF